MNLKIEKKKKDKKVFRCHGYYLVTLKRITKNSKVIIQCYVYKG